MKKLFFTLMSFTLLVPLFSSRSHAGAGKVRVVEESGLLVGEADLTVALDWDPDDPGGLADWEEIENYIRNTSTILCDMTDGNFRLGRVRFVRSSSSAYQADVVATEGGLMVRSGAGGYIGNMGDYIKFFWNNGSAALAHELGHYVFELGDSYGEAHYWGGPCITGTGVEGGSNSIMGENYTAKCTYFDGSDWIDTDYTCYHAPECAEAALDPSHASWGITDPVWGEGLNDNIRCMRIIGSELSTKVNFDTINGVGALFDRRADEPGNTGPWGDPSSSTLYKRQLNSFTKNAIQCCDGEQDKCDAIGVDSSEELKDPNGRCLYDCPPTRSSSSIDVRIYWDFTSTELPPANDWYPTGNEVVYSEAYANAVNFSGTNKGVESISVLDRLGIAKYRTGVHSYSMCNLNADSIHTTLLGVNYFSPLATITLPQVHLAPIHS
jgi:hypothetical protein